MGGEQSGRLQRRAVSHVPAVGQPGDIHPRGVDAVALRQFLDDLPQEGDIIDILDVGRVVSGTAAAVPVLVEAVGIDDHQSLAVGDVVELAARHLAHA